jgi:hypothetical protein
MRLGDAGLRNHTTMLIYLKHRIHPLAHDDTSRSLEPIVRAHSEAAYRRRLDCEFPLSDQGRRVSSGQQHSTKAPQIRMLDYMFQDTEGNAFAAVLWQNVHVGKVCERCFVCYGTSKANLFALIKNAKTQGIVYRAFDDGAWNAGRPVRLRQKAMNRPYVEAGFVACDFVWRHKWIEL